MRYIRPWCSILQETSQLLGGICSVYRATVMMEEALWGYVQLDLASAMAFWCLSLHRRRRPSRVKLVLSSFPIGWTKWKKLMHRWEKLLRLLPYIPIHEQSGLSLEHIRHGSSSRRRLAVVVVALHHNPFDFDSSSPATANRTLPCPPTRFLSPIPFPGPGYNLEGQCCPSPQLQNAPV